MTEAASAEKSVEQRAEPSTVRLRGVDRRYTFPAEFFALKGVCLELHPGELVAVTGASGSGKSTLLSPIAGIDHPTSGEISVAGRAIHQLGEDALARFRGRHVGVVFQSFFNSCRPFPRSKMSCLPWSERGIRTTLSIAELPGLEVVARSWPTLCETRFESAGDSCVRSS